MSKIFAVFALVASLFAFASVASADWNVTGGSVGISIFGESGAVATGTNTSTSATGWGQANLNYTTPVGTLSGGTGFSYGASGPNGSWGNGGATIGGSWFNTNSPCGISPCGGQGH